MDGVKTCFKKINQCNLYAQCDPVEGSDTAEDELDCEQEYKKKRLVPEKATFCCQSPHHNDNSVRANRSIGVVWILAVPLDFYLECWRGEDEQLGGAASWDKFLADLPGDLQRKVSSNFLFSGTLIYVFVAILMLAGLVSFLKTHYEQRMRIKQQVVIGLRALLFSVTRFGCVFAFFWPFKGLESHVSDGLLHP